MTAMSRRRFVQALSALAAAGVVTAPTGCGRSAAPVALPAPRPVAQRADPTAAGELALTVVNRSGAHTDGAVWVHVVGTDLATGRQSYVRPDGTLTPCELSDNTVDGYAAYGIPLNALGALTLPKMSGRVYISIGQQIPFRVVGTPDGVGVQHPAGWVVGDPSYRILYDLVEFTYNDAGMFCNTTMVDMFSIPLSITLMGAASQATGALVDSGRDRVFADLAAQPQFSRLIVDDLRVIAPGHGLDAGLFPADYFDGVIGAVWDRYRDVPLTVTTNAGVHTCRVDPGAGTLDIGRDGQIVSRISRPSTRDVLFCDGALAAPNDGITGPVAAVLGAALNRSTLLSFAEQPTTDAATFYRDPVTNHYARAMHANTVDGKAYGFAFDDVADHASYIQDALPTSVTVTLTPF